MKDGALLVIVEDRGVIILVTVSPPEFKEHMTELVVEMPGDVTGTEHL